MTNNKELKKMTDTAIYCMQDKKAKDILVFLIDKSNYNTSVRIKMFIDRNPALFLDEPNSVELEKIHKASKVYIYLSEINADKEMIKLAANELQSAVDKMRKKKYNPNIPAKVKKNIRYHYFSVGKD